MLSSFSSIICLGFCFSSAALAGEEVSFELRLRGKPVRVAVEKSNTEYSGTGRELLPVQLGPHGTPVQMSRVLVAAPAGSRGVDLSNRIAQLPGFLTIENRAFMGDAVVARFRDPLDALAASNALLADGVARYAHPDFHYPVETRGGFAPWQEPMLADQWNLEMTRVTAAWRLAEGRHIVPAQTLVAVLDLGFESSHPDLQDAWLVNPGEIPANKKDDDGNGLIDDVAGWNFAVNGNNLLHGASNKHGTATSGIVGARANGQGIAGICSWCRVLPVVVDVSLLNQVAAFRYAHSRGARIFSNSWGYRMRPPETDVVVEAINEVARDSVIIFAMSNAATNDCRQPSPDISAIESVIAISSVNRDGVKVTSSGSGPCMELVAPSSGGPSDPAATPGIWTTDRVGQPGYNTGADPANLTDPDYTNSFWGTSAAAPQVGGIVAMLQSFVPGASPAALREAILSTAQKVGGSDAGYDGNGFSSRYGFGMIDAEAALEKLLDRSARGTTD
jgi:hypothetical protein